MSTTVRVDCGELLDESRSMISWTHNIKHDQPHGIIESEEEESWMCLKKTMSSIDGSGRQRGQKTPIQDRVE